MTTSALTHAISKVRMSPQHCEAITCTVKIFLMDAQNCADFQLAEDCN
jgi:hypothetical protein